MARNDTPDVTGAERDLARLAQDAHPRRLPIDPQDDGLHLRGGDARLGVVGHVPQELRAGVHHVDTCRGVRLAGLLLALADEVLEVSMGGHAGSPSATPPQPPPSAA
jgi:hypothetical protein